MYFAIRDDDISYFTNPKYLKKIYKGIWDHVPISFAVIPFIHGSVQFIPKKHQKNKIYPIDKNKILIKFLKNKIENDEACIMLHGYSHRLNIKGHEFDIDSDLYEKTKKGKEYLEKLFDTKIKSFVAPNHSFSKEGISAVINNRLNIVGSPQITHRPLFFDYIYIKNILKLSLFRFFHDAGIRYPYPINFKIHKELYCYSIVPSVNFNELKKGFEFSLKKKGVFCLAIHSNTINNKNLNMLKHFLNKSKENNVEYATVDKIL